MPTLTPTALTAAYYLQKSLWADAQRKADYLAEVNAANALIENTTAKIQDLADKDKKKTVRVYWNKFTAGTPSTSTPDFCTPTGNAADSDSQDYTLSKDVSDTFTIDEALYESNILNISEVFADNMLKTKKACDEKLAKVLVATLDGFTSPNLYTTTGIGCPDTGPSWASTYIEPAKWTPELMYYLHTVARINKFSSPFLLDGKNLGYKIWEAMMNAGNANGSGANKMMSLFKYYEDLVNVEAISSGKTFMVNRGTTAFVNRSRWTGATAANPIMEPEISRIKYSEASENIPGVTYDIYIKTTCSGAYKKHDVLVHAMYDLFNGTPTVGGSTGVLEFICGPCPA